MEFSMYRLITCFHEFCNYEFTIFFHEILFIYFFTRYNFLIEVKLIMEKNATVSNFLR